MNTFVYGYYYDLEKVAHKLQQENIIDIRFWMSDTYTPAEKKFSCFDFFNENFISVYSEEYLYYTKDLVIDDKVYQDVLQKLPVFLDLRMRHFHPENYKDYYYLLDTFNLLFRFFYGLLVKEKVELVLFSNFPHESPDYIIYCIAKALNIRVIMLSQSILANRFFYTDSFEDIGTFDYMQKQREVQEFFLESHEDNLWYMAPTFRPKNVENIQAKKSRLIRNIQRLPRKTKEFLALFNKKKLALHTLNNAPSIKLKNRIANYEHNLALAKPVDYTLKYVYFPLHLQPELTTSPLGGIYADQLLALEKLAEFLPSDYYIYVKENPKQDGFRRHELFFERLELIPRTMLTPRTENTHKLIENSQFVATITGTAGWEAIQRGKPALTFGKAWYNSFEGVFEYTQDVKFSDIAHHTINRVKLEKDVNELLNKMGEGIVDDLYCPSYAEYKAEDNIEGIYKFLYKLISNAD